MPGAPPARALPQLRVELANGACQLAWNGAPVNGQGLLDAAVRELEGAIQRAGGPAAMTGNILTAAVAGTPGWLTGAVSTRGEVPIRLSGARSLMGS